MQPLFFSVMGLLGLEHESSDSSMAYVIYVMSIAGSSLIIYIFSTVKHGVLKGEALLLGIIIIFLAVHKIWVLFDPLNTILFPEIFIFFLLFGLPGFLSAAATLKLGLLPDLIRVSEILIVVMSVGIISFSVLPSLAGIRVASLAGASYQTLSYYGAFAFGMLLIYNFHLPNQLRFRVSSQSWYRLANYCLMIGCLTACILGGGRGAFLLLGAYFIMGVLLFFSDKTNFRTTRRLTSTVFKLMSIIVVAIIFVTTFGENDFVQAGFDRATQFIGDDGAIDLERGSSGRDVVYSWALEYIQQQPIIGYGPFGFRDKTLHPHNLFLEIWLQFGIIGVFIFLMVGAALLLKTFKNRDQYTIWIFSLFLYPFVMTMFSGTYLHTAIFIFCISFMVIHRKYRNHRLLA
ncbi:hypothetical protein IDAT_05930 [Pseudidiomarina atlantica]|uniref:O-antigen ligase-related domain-containing protein n=2 Tax=Pseudidiomarina atlantica TaxID=1517416 RepID=A0A094ITQ5_9GAMM|nr:hypothetical protein IDAT_05930 [Pseudidiomarina atlantica]